MDYDLIRRIIKRDHKKDDYIYLIQRTAHMLTASLYTDVNGFSVWSNDMIDIIHEDYSIGVTVITPDSEKLITQYNPELDTEALMELILFQEFNLTPKDESRQAVLEKSLKQENIKNTLVWACYINDKTGFYKRLEKASKTQLDKSLKYVGTPLGLCAAHDDLEGFKMLLDKGANLLKKSFVSTPIQIAFSCSDSIALYLLENYKNEVISAIKKDGFLFARNNTNKEILEAVYNLGADLIGDDPCFPNLHNFADANNVVGLEFLLDKGVDINLKNKNNKTALDRAIMQHSQEAIDFLTSRGAKTAR